jgi:very-short-patch-repair endonuclease
MADTWDELLAEQHGVFTKSQAAGHGIGAPVLADRLRDGVYREVAPRTFYAGGAAPLPTGALRWRALLSLTDATISHLTAAEVWRLSVPASSDVHVTVPRKKWKPRDGVAVHRAQHLTDADITTRDGLRVTGLERTLIDAFELLKKRDDRRTLIADAFRSRRTTTDRMSEAILRIPQLRRRAELVYTIDLAAGGSHSAGEMRLYEFVAAWDLPAPERQFVPQLPKGKRYVDCALPAYKIALEYDGRLHLTDRQKHDDIMRDQLLRRLQWHTIRVTELRMRDAEQLAADIWQDIVDRAAALGVPPPPTPPWSLTDGPGRTRDIS